VPENKGWGCFFALSFSCSLSITPTFFTGFCRMVTSPLANVSSWAPAFYAQAAGQPSAQASALSANPAAATAAAIPNLNPVATVVNPQTAPNPMVQPTPVNEPNPWMQMLKTIGMQLAQVFLGGLLSRLFA
jgi:hypothetical protein